MAVVTISRQAGSLGDEVARELAAELGYHLVTPQEMHQLAVGHDPSFAGAVKDLELDRGMGLLERLFFAQPVFTSLYAAVILELASRGRTVIIGRGAQVVLKEVPGVVRARVVAPTRVRAARQAQALGLDLEEARRYLERHDAERRALVRQIFDHDLRDWGLYNLVLNTEIMDLPGAVAIIRQLVAEVLRLQPREEVSRRLSLMALGKRVETMLRKEMLRSKVLEVNLSPEGALVLSGYLRSEAERQKAGQLAVSLAGPVEVRNEIRATAFVGWPS
jgi:cytidylate kinase